MNKVKNSDFRFHFSVYNLSHFIIVCVITFSLCLSNSTAFSQEIQETLTLDRCIKLALSNNELIKIAEQNLNVAKGKRLQAFSHFLPHLSFVSSYTRLSEIATLDMTSMLLQPEGDIGSLVRFYGYDTYKYEMGRKDNYSAKLSLTQSVFTWGKNYQGYKQAAFNCIVAQEEYNRTKNELILNVKRAFYSVLLTEQFVTICQEAVNVIEKHYNVTKALYKEGKVSGYDVSRVKVQLVNAKTELIKAENKRRLARKSLLNIVNSPKTSDMRIKGELNKDSIYENQSMEEIKKLALKNRPEIKQIKIQKKIGKSMVNLAKAQNMPNIIFSGTYEYKKPFYFENKWDKSWNVSCILSFPFFTGFSTFGSIKQTKSIYNQIILKESFLIEKIKLEVEKAYLDLEEAKERIDAQKENVKTARKNLDIAQERYKRGLMSDIEVRDAQLSLTQAETSYLQALYDYNVAQAELEKAVGKKRKEE